MITRMFRAVGISLLLVLALSSSPALAFNPFGNVCDKGTSSSAVCTDKTGKDPISGTNGLIANITTIVSYAAGAAAIIVLIYGSVKYITSGGDSNNVKNAKDTIIYALVGLAVVVLARSLIFFVLSKF